MFMTSEPLAGWRHVTVTDRRTATDFAEVLRWLAEDVYPEADKIVLVMDNLNTHKLASLYEAFPAEQARRIAECFESHHPQARALAERGGDRVGCGESPVPRPADRVGRDAAAGTGAVGGGAERSGERGQLAVHDHRCPDQAPTALPSSSKQLIY